MKSNLQKKSDQSYKKDLISKDQNRDQKLVLAVASSSSLDQDQVLVSQSDHSLDKDRVLISEFDTSLDKDRVLISEFDTSSNKNRVSVSAKMTDLGLDKATSKNQEGISHKDKSTSKQNSLEASSVGQQSSSQKPPDQKTSQEKNQKNSPDKNQKNNQENSPKNHQVKNKINQQDAKNDSFLQNLKDKFDLNSFLQRGLIFILVFALFVPYLSQNWRQSKPDFLSIGQMVQDVRDEKVEKISVVGDEMKVLYKDSGTRVVLKEPGQDALSIFDLADIDLVAIGLEVERASAWAFIGDILISILPVLLFVGIFVYMVRQSRGAQNSIMGIGKSKAKLFVKGKQNTKFADVGGMSEAKKELEEIVDFLKNPKKYQKVGARTPKGVLLVGPAGTGKTLLARAVAGEADVQFLSIAGSEFMEMLVGVGASRARDLFTTAKKIAPSIIFIDEIDAIGRTRGQGSLSSHDEREQTLNQILVEMDGFAQTDNVIVMAATNRGDMLDPALVRPGRFDRRVVVNLPDLDERRGILKIHAQGKPIDEAVNWEKVAKRTVGFSGADIENMLNESAIAVAREEREKITTSDIEEASLKVKLGPSKKRLHDERERKMTAYHEAGHALVAHMCPHADPVHSISIVSRGRALGFTLTPPERDKLQTTKSELLDQIAVLLGGRAAEKLIFDELTAGASSDIERATRIARAMVVDYGMSDLGPVQLSAQYETGFSNPWSEPQRISPSLQEKVDAQIAFFISQGQDKADKLLVKYKDQLDSISQALLERETLDADEFSQIMKIPKAKL